MLTLVLLLNKSRLRCNPSSHRFLIFLFLLRIPSIIPPSGNEEGIPVKVIFGNIFFGCETTKSLLFSKQELIKSLASDFASAVGNLTTKDPVLVFRMLSTGIDFKALLTSSVAWVSLAESVLPPDFGFTMRTCRSCTVLVCPKALTVMASSSFCSLLLYSCRVFLTMLAKVSGIGSTGRPALPEDPSLDSILLIRSKISPRMVSIADVYGLNNVSRYIRSSPLPGLAGKTTLAIPSKAISHLGLHKGKVLLGNAITAEMNPASTTCTLQGMRGLAYTLPTRNTVVLGHYLKTTE